MSVLETLQLTAPGWLLLLPPLWLLAWHYSRCQRRESGWSRLCDRHLLERMRGGSAAEFASPWLCWPLVIVFSLGIVGAAGPGWRAQTEAPMAPASARIVALDLSRAMLVEDVRPSRHAQAIAAAREIVSGQFEGETGLVVFAGAAFKVAPLSRDVDTLLAFIDALEPGIVPIDGIRPDLAIDSARELLSASVFGRGQIIVLTAGVDRTAETIAAAARAADAGHRVSIVAIGSSTGGPRVDADGGLIRDANGRQVLAKTDFDALARVAAAGNGDMVPLQRVAGSDLLLLSRVEAATLVEAHSEPEPEPERKRQAIADEGYWLVWLLLPAALLLFRRNLVWLLLIAVLPPGFETAAAADYETFWQHRDTRAFAAYRQRDFAVAASLARSPMLKGTALYRQDDFTGAMEMFGQDDTAAAHYNRGNSLVQLERYDEAIGAYARALELDPGLAAARFNRRLVTLFLQQGEATEDTAADNGDIAGEDFETAEQGADLRRIGTIGQEFSNPADQQQLESGLGASRQSGQAAPFERFDGSEEALERFVLREGSDPDAAALVFERWVETLPATSSDLFKRKFLRDYERQKRQVR